MKSISRRDEDHEYNLLAKECSVGMWLPERE